MLLDSIRRRVVSTAMYVRDSVVSFVYTVDTSINDDQVHKPPSIELQDEAPRDEAPQDDTAAVETKALKGGYEDYVERHAQRMYLIYLNMSRCVKNRMTYFEYKGLLERQGALFI